MRIERIGDATLYLGDCLTVLPTLGAVDCVVTDPPYGLGDRMNGGTWGAADKYSVLRQWDQKPPQEIVDGLLALGVPTILWGGNYFSVPASRCWLSWSKLNAVPTMSCMELAWTNLDRPAKEKRLPVGSHETGHPTQKPVALMRWCISHLPDTAETICDPFMGSGTTGVACAKMGRKFIGIEIDETYFDIACKRIADAYKQPDLFIEPPAKAEQTKLL